FCYAQHTRLWGYHATNQARQKPGRLGGHLWPTLFGSPDFAIGKSAGSIEHRIEGIVMKRSKAAILQASKPRREGNLWKWVLTAIALGIVAMLALYATRSQPTGHLDSGTST